MSDDRDRETATQVLALVCERFNRSDGSAVEAIAAALTKVRRESLEAINGKLLRLAAVVEQKAHETDVPKVITLTAIAMDLRTLAGPPTSPPPELKEARDLFREMAGPHQHVDSLTCWQCRAKRWLARHDATYQQQKDESK